LVVGSDATYSGFDSSLPVPGKHPSAMDSLRNTGLGIYFCFSHYGQVSFWQNVCRYSKMRRFLLDRLIDQIKGMTLKAGLFGLDINKKGTPQGDEKMY
jgi:hypothetical protein